MNRTLYSYLLITVLLGLLGLLATLQYQWLGKISEAEKTRLELRLQEDTKRFTNEFDREMQKVFFSFQIDAEDFENKNWDNFNKRFVYWKTQTEYPELVQNVYYYDKNNNREYLKFDNNQFVETIRTLELNEAEKSLINDKEFSPILEKQTMLAIPVYKKEEHLETIVVQSKEIHSQKINSKTELKLPVKYGFLLIKLNEDLIKTKIIPNLIAKYFSVNEGADFKIAVTNNQNNNIFQTHNEKLTASDSTSKFFNLSPNDIIFFNKEIGDNILNSKVRSRGEFVFKQQNSMTSSQVTESKDEKNEVVSVNVQRVNDGKPRIAVFEGQGKIGEGIWTINVQHTSGSLEQFINNTRYKNLAISFGILTLLAISIILIFLSSQRAKMLAQRQVDFVSSVSHEFRTPLAVIYSAGENLSDGVIGEQEKISNYGNLIKREGKKLSGMVEQILEFAGARSGNRKYDFRELDIPAIINEAIRECQPFIEEKNFEVETEIVENLPKIFADETALTQALQNLINNSLKYSNGESWLKISAKNGDGKIKISVEDKGIGISDKDKKQIFEPFYRAESVVDEQISGNGLGLSLVKQIIEAHGGKVSVESEIGKGSKFIVHLPLNIKH